VAAAALLDDPAGKAFTLGLTDRVVRAATPAAAGRALVDLLEQFGAPSFLGAGELLLRAAGLGALAAPGVVVPQIVRHLRREAGEVVVPGEPGPLHRFLDRQAEGGHVLDANDRLPADARPAYPAR
jgi:RHH-type proline utilization regulon transcriptional repressor/proline dehydrogenase/delta 1-pyrroline-5-carboxylate dehydrogenase